MRRTIRTLGSLSAAGLLGLAACGGGDGTGPNGQRPDDASLAAIAALPLVPGSLAETAPGLSPAVMALTPAGGLPAPVCAYQQGTGRYDCEAITREGVAITRSFAFFDETGRPQRRFDPVSTASINTRVTIVGTEVIPQGDTVRIDRHGDMTVSGLAGAETSQTLHGLETGTREFSGPSPFGGSYLTKYVSNDTALDVVIPVPPRPAAGASPPYVFPISGKRITTLRISNPYGGAPQGALPDITTRHVVTYSGTSNVTIELTIGDRTKTCTVDVLAPLLQGCSF